VKLNREEINALNYELGMTFDTTLTEKRYNEIMDALLPTLEGSPEAQATLAHFGKTEWIERRYQQKKETAA
jgi:hypothetical protein